jgi:hypothetical protein
MAIWTEARFAASNGFPEKLLTHGVTKKINKIVSRRTQGCQIFLCAKYQNGKNIPK